MESGNENAAPEAQVEYAFPAYSTTLGNKLLDRDLVVHGGKKEQQIGEFQILFMWTGSRGSPCYRSCNICSV